MQLHDGAPGRRPAAASHAAEMPAYTTTRRRVRYETEPRGLETPRIRRDARPSGRTPRLASPEGTRIRLSQVEIGFPTSRRNPVAISQGLLHEAASSHFKRKASPRSTKSTASSAPGSQAEARPRPLTPIPHRARAGRRWDAALPKPSIESRHRGNPAPPTPGIGSLEARHRQCPKQGAANAQRRRRPSALAQGRGGSTACATMSA